MAEENDPSRTEPASAKRLQQARRAGDVPRSAEWSAWLILLAGMGALLGFAPALYDTLTTLIQVALQQAAQPGSAFDPASPLHAALAAAMWATLPVLGLVFAAGVAGPLLLSGWTASPDADRVHAARANPLRALTRRCSAEGAFDAALLLLKMLLLGGVAWGVSTFPGAFDGAYDFGTMAAWLGRTLIALAAALALTAALDAGWRWWRYLRRHAMTWQEVLAEARESEVSPEVRARLRARQQQAGQGSASRASAVDEVIG
ncbi:MAG: EscU/YscU/HrcU family type III secretion system export apparatus switch protein [Thiobacillus sp.]|nr:EscU/YscU/HrcU family type III secretion system export apparatus switch protein [Thiobacillus sp.]